MTRRRILVLMPAYLPGFRAGGPIRSVAAFVEAYGDREAFAIVTGDTDWGDKAPLDVPTTGWVTLGKARVHYCSSAGRFPRLAAARSWCAALLGTAAPDVLYLNGMFPKLASVLPVLLHRTGMLPAGHVVIAPRGEFSTGALELGSGAKGAFIALSRILGLYRDVVWHASTELEATEIRAVMGDVPVVVRENETLLPASPLPVGAREDGPLRLVFLSRIGEKKGLHVLLEALREVRTPVRLDVHGSSDATYLDRCRGLASAVADVHTVRFHGAVEHDRVRGVFARADLFAFPTAGENFGHAIAESLSAATPVMVTDTTPWSGLLGGGGGEVVPTRDPADWARRIEAWAARSAQELTAARHGAARAYAQWRSARPQESVFDLVDALDV